MAANAPPRLASSVNKCTRAAMEKVEGPEETGKPSVKRNRHEVKEAPFGGLVYEDYNSCEGWLCFSTNMYLDGFALVVVLSTSWQARKLKQWQKKAYEAARCFDEANCFLQGCFREDTMNMPGFGGETDNWAGNCCCWRLEANPSAKTFTISTQSTCWRIRCFQPQTPTKGGVGYMPSLRHTAPA